MKSFIIAALIAGSFFFAPCGFAADFQDQGVKTQFEKGTLRLKYSMLGSGAGGGAALNTLYAEKRWAELVEGVVGKRYVSDLYYFYLGAAAEALGYSEAALNYYDLSLAAYRNGDRCTVGFDSCRGVAMPAAVVERVNTLRNPAKELICKPLKASMAPAQLELLQQRAEKVLQFADRNRVSLIANAMCGSVFKKGIYLAVMLPNPIEYNENTLTNYMIGARVFDDVVRKVLPALAGGDGDLAVDGYDVTVISYKKTFGIAQAIPTKVQYRFYLPKGLAERYLDKDISSQQLLDGSVILLNDDRIDLKLQ
ncbi:hypothetical protein IP92_03263 [Pseudoduganella flava]|nr:hypothetical protein IP92_03263 [Pseudoduganella flava]